MENRNQLAERIVSLRSYYRQPSNFFEFCINVLGYKDLQVDPHWELCGFITQCKGDGSNRTSNKSNFPLKGQVAKYDRPDIRRILALDPRGSFKSSILTVAYAVWRLLYDPYLRILVGSYNQDKAVEFLAEIQDKITCPEVQQLFGDVSHGKKGVRWSKNEMQLWDVAKDCPVPFDKMASVRAIGMETGIASVHCDIFIGDDLVCDKNVGTEEGLEKPKQFVKFMEPIINPGGEMIIVGTRYHYSDLYGSLIDNGMFDVHLRAAFNEDGSLYFPQRLTHQFLEAKRRSMGPYDFSCQYMNDPVTPDSAKFQGIWVDRCLTSAACTPS